MQLKWPHNPVNILKSTESHTLSYLIAWRVNYSPIIKLFLNFFKKEINPCYLFISMLLYTGLQDFRIRNNK